MKGSTSTISINSGLDPALLKHLNAFDGFKLDGSYSIIIIIIVIIIMRIIYI